MPKTRHHFILVFVIIAAGLLLGSVIFLSGCSSAQADKFRQRIHAMSDAELLSYYEGIGQRSMDLDHQVQRDQQLYPHQPRHNIYPTPFLLGGEGYDLHQKRKMVLEEMRRRHISP